MPRLPVAWIPVILLGVAAVVAGVEIGDARAVAQARSDAVQAAQRGDYPRAIALNRAVAARGGPLFLFAGQDRQRAAAEIPALTLTWAQKVAASGDVDGAAAVAAGLHTAAGDAARGSILLTEARARHAAGDDGDALLRLAQVTAGPASAAARAEAAQLRPTYQIGDAQALVTAGFAADAVTELDAAVASHVPAAVATAQAALPGALLAAGRQSVSAGALHEAATFLKRLTTEYPGSSAATVARRLLAAPQKVTGTLVHHDGSALSANVRLSSHFHNVSGGYVTSEPFYHGHADAHGNFTFTGVPLGGPYVLEVETASGWETFIDPTTGKPADPVTVSALEPTDLAFIVLPA